MKVSNRYCLVAAGMQLVGAGYCAYLNSWGNVSLLLFFAFLCVKCIEVPYVPRQR